MHFKSWNKLVEILISKTIYWLELSTIYSIFAIFTFLFRSFIDFSLKDLHHILYQNSISRNKIIQCSNIFKPPHCQSPALHKWKWQAMIDPLSYVIKWNLSFPSPHTLEIHHTQLGILHTNTHILNTQQIVIKVQTKTGSSYVFFNRMIAIHTLFE